MDTPFSPAPPSGTPLTNSTALPPRWESLRTAMRPPSITTSPNGWMNTGTRDLVTTGRFWMERRMGRHYGVTNSTAT